MRLNLTKGSRLKRIAKHMYSFLSLSLSFSRRTFSIKFFHARTKQSLALLLTRPLSTESDKKKYIYRERERKKKHSLRTYIQAYIFFRIPQNSKNRPHGFPFSRATPFEVVAVVDDVVMMPREKTMPGYFCFVKERERGGETRALLIGV